ncbi:MAG: hypothetical protein C0596_06530 [Marinilabiliales bacterium]|nr:MAG: hypothetical protein C0596_06530 [Marinilabiliales bacterium]
MCLSYKTIVMLLVTITTFVTLSYSQEINLTFKSTYACAYEGLDSVKVENLTQGGDTVLYYPDTVLTINLSGIEEHLLSKQGFYISQNYPNPFANETKFEVNVIEDNHYSFQVIDLTGKQVAKTNKYLKRGVHEFTFVSGQSGSYIISVNSEKYAQRILVICGEVSQNSGFKLIYNDYSYQSNLLTRSTKSNFVFAIGDQLKYTVYINGESEEIIDIPEGDKLYTFNLFVERPARPTVTSSIIGEGTLELTWDDVIGASGFKYNTVNDFYSAIDIGLTYGLTREFSTDVECGIILDTYIWSYNDCHHSSQTRYEGFIEYQFDDTINSEKYNTVLIGNQCWMKENLRSSKYANGDDITHLPDESWYLLETDAWVYYDNDPNNNIPYGKLYNINAVFDERNVCPEGWHVPSDAEWTVLNDYLGGQFVAGGKMKIQGTDYWLPPNDAATNTSYFSAYTSGGRYFDGEFNGIHEVCRWWSTTYYSSTGVWCRHIDYLYPYLWRGGPNEYNGYSIRCIRDW